MKIRKYMFWILFLLVLPLVIGSSSYTFKQSESTDLKISCIDENNTFCDSATICQITINAPNGTNLVKNASMTYNDNYFNYTVNESNLQALGTYESIISCQGVNNAFSTFTFEITGGGTQPTVAQGLMYSVMILVSILLLGLTLIGAVKINGNDEFDLGGDILKINFKKYMKMGLFWMSYQFLVLLMFFSWQVVDRFLVADFMSEMFRIIFLILLIGEAPLFIGLFVILIIKVVMDMELQKVLDRGEQPR